MNTTLTLEDRRLIVSGVPGAGAIDLTRAVRAKLYDRTLTRTFHVDEFVVQRVYPLADGLRVHLMNAENGLLVPLVFKPHAAGFRVILQAGQMVEQFAINRKVLEIDLLPDLLTSKVGDDGWFLLPCFSGTRVRFKDHPPTINRDRIYMDQAEWEKVNLMNCFGLKRGDGAVLGIVHRGDFFCHVTSEINQDGRNRIYASMGLRHTEAEVVKQEDKEVIFHFLKGGDAGYPGMAKVYRQYLLNERGVSPLKVRIADNPVLAYSVQAMRTKIFMGLKSPFTVDGSNPMTIHATFEHAEKILDRMQAAGLKKAVITLVGWNLGGHDGAYPTRFPVEPALGGEEGLRRLIEKAVSMGYQIVPHDNVTDVYRSAPDFDYEYIARTEEGQPRVVGIWGGGQSFKACPVVYFERYGFEMSRVRDLGFTGHYYMDAQASVLWTCHDPRHPADEEQYSISLARMTQWARSVYGAVSTEMAPAYNLPFIDEVATIHSMNNAGYMLPRLPQYFKAVVDSVVPFYHIAVHGLITYQESWVHGYRKSPGGVRAGLLRALAVGARPSMEVSYLGGANGDPYEDSIRDVSEFYALAFDELADVHVETIEAYEELTPTARRITYSNGCRVAVNWGDSPVDGVDAMGYKVTRE